MLVEVIQVKDIELCSLIKDIYILQRDWRKKITNTGVVTKNLIVEICLPFKTKYAEKYNLRDMDVLRIARDNLSVYETLKLFNIDFI